MQPSVLACFEGAGRKLSSACHNNECIVVSCAISTTCMRIPSAPLSWGKESLSHRVVQPAGMPGKNMQMSQMPVASGAGHWFGPAVAAALSGRSPTSGDRLSGLARQAREGPLGLVAERAQRA